MKPSDYFFHKYSLYLLHKPVKKFFFYEATKAENHKTLLISFVDRKTRVWGKIHRSPYLDWWQYFCDAADSNNMKDHISNMNLSSNDIPRPCEQKERNINHCLFVCLQRYLIDTHVSQQGAKPVLEVGSCDLPLNIDRLTDLLYFSCPPQLSAPRASAHFQALAPK